MNYTQGSIGTLPWQADSLEINQYDSDHQETVITSMKILSD